jgi:hypothetical protein
MGVPGGDEMCCGGRGGRGRVHTARLVRLTLCVHPNSNARISLVHLGVQTTVHDSKSCLCSPSGYVRDRDRTRGALLGGPKDPPADGTLGNMPRRTEHSKQALRVHSARVYLTNADAGTHRMRESHALSRSLQTTASESRAFSTSPRLKVVCAEKSLAA